MYSEEVTAETVLVTKPVNGKTFYGLRVFLESPDTLHVGADDDDRSAITFWLDKEDKVAFARMGTLLACLDDDLNTASEMAAKGE